MKRIIIISILSFLSCVSFAQSYELNLSATMLKNQGELKKGADVHLNRILLSNTLNDSEIKQCYLLLDDKGNKLELTSKFKDCFEFRYDNPQELWDGHIITHVLDDLVDKGFQYNLRSEMEEDALEYIQRVKNYGLEFYDPYMESYIYSLITKIAPTRLIDGRPGSINLLIQSNSTVNACCYPNGTIVLNTGLLAALHSEDELVAILAHEIAHFILDHSVQNVNAAISRQKRAEFWAAVATGMTAFAEGFAASQGNYYTPGLATLGMAAMSTSIASKVLDRLGMKYNHKQEKEADELAVEVLKLLGYDENALASALSNIHDSFINEKNYTLYFDSETHPNIRKRIRAVGSPQAIFDKQYERAISFAVTDVAKMKYDARRYTQCIQHVNLNIENNVATADDYLLKANCILYTKDNEDAYNEVLDLIEKARLINPQNLNICKTEIIATLRIKDNHKSLQLLNQYIEQLDAYIQAQLSADDFFFTEIEWAKNMIIKLKGM